MGPVYRPHIQAFQCLDPQLSGAPERGNMQLRIEVLVPGRANQHVFLDAEVWNPGQEEPLQRTKVGVKSFVLFDLAGHFLCKVQSSRRLL